MCTIVFCRSYKETSSELIDQLVNILGFTCEVQNSAILKTVILEKILMCTTKFRDTNFIKFKKCIMGILDIKFYF